MKVKPKTICVHAKCSDMFMGSLVDDKGNLLHQYDGYVPRELGVGSGDYISFDVDAQTGQILNWKPIKEIEIEEDL